MGVSRCGRRERRRRQLQRDRQGLLTSSATPSAVNLSSNPAAVSLLKWLRGHGWRPDLPLQLARFSNTGRGLRTLQRVQSDSVLVSIPTKLLLTRERALEASWARGIDNIGLLKTQELLSLFLLFEKSLGGRSFWFHYLQTMPTSYDVPFFCAEEELVCFPAYIREKCLLQKRLVGDSFGKVRPLIRSFHFSPSSYAWAWFTVNTRAVYLPPLGKASANSDDCLALAPFLDMFNHSCQARVRVGVNIAKRCPGQNDVYQIVSENSFEKGAEVFINYGPHDNLKLMLEYGFLVPGNLHESVPIGMQDLIANCASAADVRMNLPSKTRLLKSSGLAEKMNVSATGVSWNLLACLYVLMLPEASLLEWHKVYREENLDGLNDHVTLALLRNVLQNIVTCQIKLEAFDGRQTNCCKIITELLSVHRGLLEGAIARHAKIM